MTKLLNQTRIQSIFLVLLRIFIGWHLLYEGMAKLLIPGWSSEGYLISSKWIFSGLFHSLAANEAALNVVDFLNIWGLILIGLGLVVGLFTRYASIAGMVLLFFYYIAQPPFLGTDIGIPREGHYMFIDRNLVEIIGLGLLAVFPSGLYFGLDRFLKSRSGVEPSPPTYSRQKEQQSEQPGAGNVQRREILRYLAMVPILGAFAWGTRRKYQWNLVNAVSGATIKVGGSKLNELEGELPVGKILGKPVSRIIAGGNLIGGWAHARDLLYVGQLFKAYNTDVKVFETLSLAEKSGINTVNILHTQLELINKYKRIYDSKLQTIVQVHPHNKDVFGDADRAMDLGGDFIQIQGNAVDFRVRDGEIDILAKCIDRIKSRGFPAGLGAHSVQALQACEEAGIEPDFYLKTFHHDNYWSAHPKENRIPFSVDGQRSNDHNEFHDNMFCMFPDETTEFMKKKEIPWVAFKVLAGGAIHPEEGFRYAFGNGADFICVGMFDWQVVEDVNIAVRVLNNLENRERSWYA